MISAHGGGDEVFPAQTYEAFEHAAGSGVELVEFDVRRLADGTLVCFHEPALDAPLWTLTYDDLCAGAGYEVPLVRRVLELLAGRTTCHIDLKETGHEAEVAAMARRIVGLDGFIVTSMADVSLRRLRPEVSTALSIGRGPGDVPWRALPLAIAGDLFPARRLRDCGATGVAINRLLAPWVLDRCKRLGVTTMVWTVDRSDEIERYLADPRVDVLITNRPLFALQRRAAHAKAQDHRR